MANGVGWTEETKPNDLLSQRYASQPMINKTLAQMNAERAAGPARHNLKLKSSSPPPPSRELQAASAMKKTQLNNRIKKEREKKI